MSISRPRRIPLRNENAFVRIGEDLSTLFDTSNCLGSTREEFNPDLMPQAIALIAKLLTGSSGWAQNVISKEKSNSPRSKDRPLFPELHKLRVEFSTPHLKELKEEMLHEAELYLRLLLKNTLTEEEKRDKQNYTRLLNYGVGNENSAFGHREMGEYAKQELMEYYLGIEKQLPCRIEDSVQFLTKAKEALNLEGYFFRNDVTVGCDQIVGDRLDPASLEDPSSIPRRGVDLLCEQKAMTLMAEDKVTREKFMIVLYTRADQKANVEKVTIRKDDGTTVKKWNVDKVQAALKNKFPDIVVLDDIVEVGDLANYGLEPGCITPVSVCCAMERNPKLRILQVIDEQSHITGWTTNSLSATIGYAVKGEQLEAYLQSHAPMITIGNSTMRSWQEMSNIVLDEPLEAKKFTPNKVEPCVTTSRNGPSHCHR